VGSVQLQFWLAETRLRGLRLHEGLAWAGLAIVTLAQVALIGWLLR